MHGHIDGEVQDRSSGYKNDVYAHLTYLGVYAMYRNTIELYKNSMTGECRTMEGWKQWAEGFYSALTYDEAGRDVSVVKHINITMPKDWFQRVSKVLRLEPVSE